MGDHRAAAALCATMIGASLACAGGSSPAVREWFDTAYAPAMQQIMDPDLAPWSLAATGREGGAGPTRPRPSPGQMQAGCAEALRRLDGWRDVLEGAPDDALATAMSAYVLDQSERLRTCAETGIAPGGPTTLEPVIDRLERLGMRLPQS